MITGTLTEASASSLALLVARRKVSPVEIVEAALARIAAIDGPINAFVHLCPEQALAEARRQEAALAQGDDIGVLAGLPLGVKDLEDVAGLPTTHGSMLFRDHVAAHDSVQVARLRAAGAIVVGKTNTPEFGYTGFTKNRLFGVTRNPWNLERTPGGSSGGSAAAIAARMVPLATASDGGGSIRIPACYVGAFGFKPTFGRIPHEPGTLRMLHWVDTVHHGPLTRTVEDAALFLDVTAGYHPLDPDSLPPPSRSYRATLDAPLPKLRIGFSRDLGYARVRSDVLREVEGAVEVFRALGHEVSDADLHLPDVGRAWAYACGAEQYGELAPHVGGREAELGRAFWSGVKAASHISAAEMGDIARERYELTIALAQAFERYDVLLMPTLPTDAFAAAGPMPAGVDGVAFDSPMHPVAFTYPFNFSGHPAASIRAGFTDAGLPAGLQIVAERHRDELVLQVARAYERERPLDRWPEL